MIITAQNIDHEFNRIRERPTWNNETRVELKMHKIHVYPAKFPSFLIGKSLDYARDKNIRVDRIGDIFCGCGTTGLEAKKYNKQFWGCDINPVATLIASVKRNTYNVDALKGFYDSILLGYENSHVTIPEEILNHERINYWFHLSQIEELNKLLFVIRDEVDDITYRNFFYVAFSNILKRTSKWLTKSIKPQVDPGKRIYSVLASFKYQFTVMLNAVKEANGIISHQPVSEIVTRNFLEVENLEPFLDMLICSPPYVTSYEYADLHQLSTMWLGYVDDFRDLRLGTIGSLYNHNFNVEEIEDIDPSIIDLYNRLKSAKKSSPKSVIKYFIDIKETVEKTYSLINTGGLAVFVIGNTTYKSIYINNAKFITTNMLNAGFEDVEVFKRKISSKTLSPYRDKNGKFTKNKNDRKVYSFEYVVIGKKP